MGLLAGPVHAKRMKSFLRYVETGKARNNAAQPAQDDSSDASYQKALSNVGSVVPLPPDFVSSPSASHPSRRHGWTARSGVPLHHKSVHVDLFPGTFSPL